jgi:hypothetical protein
VTDKRILHNAFVFEIVQLPQVCTRGCLVFRLFIFALRVTDKLSTFSKGSEGIRTPAVRPAVATGLCRPALIATIAGIKRARCRLAIFFHAAHHEASQGACC